jgi:hypothetical protein
MTARSKPSGQARGSAKHGFVAALLLALGAIGAAASAPPPAQEQASASPTSVLHFGAAHAEGASNSYNPAAAIAGMAATPDGGGYWLAGADGAVYGFGDAAHYGDRAGKPLHLPIVGIAATPDGGGYWLAGADGAVYSFGDAGYYGGTAGKPLGSPIVGMAVTTDGHGYWLAGADGAVYGFGDAAYYGGTAGKPLGSPIVGMAVTTDGHGYWLAGADGAVYGFGDAAYYGDAARTTLAEPVVALVPTPSGTGYWLAEGHRATADLFSQAFDAALGAQPGAVSAAVLDLRTGCTYEYRPGTELVAASIVKLEILGALLAQDQARGRSLNPEQQVQAQNMIEASDNDDATALWRTVGGTPAVAAFDRSVGMVATTPNHAWGLTTTTAADQLTLLQHLVEPGSVLSGASRAYELHLMQNVEPSQAWGVSAGMARGTTVALKDGWLRVKAGWGTPVQPGWEVNSVGWARGSGRDYLIALLSSGSPTEADGIASISMVARTAWAALGPLP